MQQYLIKIAGSKSFLLRASRRVIADSQEDATGMARDFLANYRRVSTAGADWDTWTLMLEEGKHYVGVRVDGGTWGDLQ